jgi:hypothetical protein
MHCCGHGFLAVARAEVQLQIKVRSDAKAFMVDVQQPDTAAGCIPCPAVTSKSWCRPEC